MQYRMKIISGESVRIYNEDINRWVMVEVGGKYIFDPLKPTTKKDRKNKGRVVEVSGFTDSFMPEGVIVTYVDNNRRGRVCPSFLVPYKE